MTERLAAAFDELNARLRGVDADFLDLDDRTDPDTLANGASFALDTDAGLVDYCNDVPRHSQPQPADITAWHL